MISNYKDCKIKRSHPVEKKINGINFYELTVKYPQLIHRFDNYEVITEITIKENENAVGVQPMLFFCFPITELKSDKNLIGRQSEKKETGKFVFSKKNYKIIFEMIKIFGILSPSHNKDIIEIITTTLYNN